MENFDDTDEFIPRAYQIDLLELAQKQNAIVYLPTGSGKTFIAVKLIQELSADIRKSYSEGGKHSVFLVNTVPLVKQQSEYIRRLTGLKCGQLSGERKIDFWKDIEWLAELDKYQVLVMTSQILSDAISHGHMFLNKINVLIFDECHKGVNDHPMRQIMQKFEHCPKDQQPRVLGLTASLLNSNIKLDMIESVIENLEITYNAKIITVRSALQIKSYFACPNETVVLFDEYTISNIGKNVNNIIDEMNKILKDIILQSTLRNNESSIEFQSPSKEKKISHMLHDMQIQLTAKGIYGGSKCALLRLIQLECIKKYTEDLDTVYVLEYIISELTKCRKLLEDEMKDNTEVEKIYKYSSDKVRKLFTVLKDFKNNMSNDQTFCCIIFVQRRFTAKILYQILKNLSEHDEEFKFLQPDFIVGFSNDPYKSIRETLCFSKWNNEAVHRLKSGITNCIVATDVVDEGIDIPNCALVIRYNLPMDVRAYIQSKGRARYNNSQYTLLVPRNDMNYLKRYTNFKQVESYLQKSLISGTLRKEPTEDTVKKKLYTYNIEPYIVTNKDGTVCTITEQIAVSLVNKYCITLLRSKFLCLTPVWKLNTIKEDECIMYQVSLKLPILSPLKSVIFGDPMMNINYAKRSAAMNACIKLYEIGELSDKLLPNVNDSITQNANHLFPNWIDEDKSENVLIGTYKKKRHHQLQFPSALYGACPLPEKLLYLHILHAKPTYSAPHFDNRYLVFYDLLSDNAGFGILSTKQMPEIPSFPIFMNVGELNVDVKVNYATMHLSKEQIGFIKVFHTLMFTKVVSVIKPFLVFDNYNRDNCFLIVPVNESWEINWNVLKQHQCIERIPSPIPFHFKNSDYELALVIPTYRASPDVYLVTKVCEDLTPSSCFPSDNFFSYAHYYKQKHGLVINDLKQPMLEVKVISRKNNCIIPRSMQSESKSRKRAESNKDLREHLVPELCTRIVFPALYWLKTTMLPSILHRISQLLIAEDLRQTIATEIGLGSRSSNNKWPPLQITDEETEELFESLVEVPIDENVENLQPEPVLNVPEIDVLNTETYNYPWKKDEEPPDLYRNIEDIQMIQIEHYCQFMSGTCDQTDNEIVKKKEINFLNKLSISVPHLKILSLEDLCDGPNPVQIMFALTSKLGHDAFNLERLETLGDSYLKFIISLFLHDQYPNYNEGPLSTLKGKLIGNRNLYYCGVKKQIPGRIKVDDFVPYSNFIAPAYTAFRLFQQLLLEQEISPNVLYEIQIPEVEQFTGCISETTINIMEAKVLNWETANSQTGMEHYLGIQTVSDKTVADCVEALIGVYLSSMGIKDTATLLKWFGILPNDINAHTLLFVNLTNPIISEGNVNYFMPWASDIETKIGYKFQNRAYLLQAFTHPSYSANTITDCYQRLEFLGDAILDFLVTCYIYENCGNLNPGALTDLRSALVNNITFACLAVRYNLHTALLAYAPKLNDIIVRFVKFQEERDHIVNDELLYILIEEDECNIAEYVNIPKVLADLFESIIGAIYLDCNKNLMKVWEIIYSLMCKEIVEFSKNIPKQPVRMLYETQGIQPRFLNAVSVEETNAVMVPLKVIIDGKMKLFHGFGINKKQAKCAAAKQALKSLLCKT
ncbi:endoribonuclease Dcr-2 [Colletes latitarsis]|uniref:endoribonuclease Dcr-2 n=1 Tax=Colletes latitarsis TaxID=2605962 RepID=UPI0040363861